MCDQNENRPPAKMLVEFNPGHIDSRLEVELENISEEEKHKSLCPNFNWKLIDESSSAYNIFCKRKNFIITIKITGNFCGYCAIGMGIKFHEWNVKNDYKQLRWRILVDRAYEQLNIGDALCQKVDLSSKVEMNFGIINEIQNSELLKEYQIIVIDYRTNEKIFVGPDKQKSIYLLHDSITNHYNFIRDITNYFEMREYCKKCNYRRKITQKCSPFYIYYQIKEIHQNVILPKLK